MRKHLKQPKKWQKQSLSLECKYRTPSILTLIHIKKDALRQRIFFYYTRKEIHDILCNKVSFTALLNFWLLPAQNIIWACLTAF